MKNSEYDTQDVKKVCEKKLGIHFREGKEFNGWFLFEGKKAARITVPKGKKAIPPKTYKSMALQLKLTIAEFDDLLACPLSKDDYVSLLSRQIS